MPFGRKTDFTRMQKASSWTPLRVCATWIDWSRSWRWLLAMALGDGSWRWLLAMALGDGSWRWLLAMALGDGSRLNMAMGRRKVGDSCALCGAFGTFVDLMRPMEAGRIPTFKTCAQSEPTESALFVSPCWFIAIAKGSLLIFRRFGFFSLNWWLGLAARRA